MYSNMYPLNARMRGDSRVGLFAEGREGVEIPTLVVGTQMGVRVGANMGNWWE